MAGTGQATEKQQDAPLPFDVAGRGVNPSTGEVAEQVWEVHARFVGFQQAKDWKMADDRNPGQFRTGTTYRVDVRVPEGTVLMKVPEGVYQGMVAERLDFGDRIAIVYGRTVSGGEMRVAPVGFRRL